MVVADPLTHRFTKILNLRMLHTPGVPALEIVALAIFSVNFDVIIQFLLIHGNSCIF